MLTTFQEREGTLKRDHLEELHDDDPEALKHVATSHTNKQTLIQ
jgi:hypothetical protein